MTMSNTTALVNSKPWKLMMVIENRCRRLSVFVKTQNSKAYFKVDAKY